MQRRTLMAASAAALAFPALAQPQSKTPLSNAALAPNPAEFRKAMADFTQGRKPLAEGLHLDVPTLAANPAAVRVRLSQSQTVHALARMKSGKLLAASHAVTVAASGCGM